MMTAHWDSADLEAIATADDLRIAPFRADGVATGTPTWIWCVAVNGALYVRAYHGIASRWYQSALRQKAGRITAAGKTYDVMFSPVSGEINDLIDEAYRSKYRTSRYLKPMIGEGARAAGIRITPAIAEL